MVVVSDRIHGWWNDRQVIQATCCEFSVMSEARKEQEQKQNPFPLRLEAQLKSKTASLPTPLDYGGAENAVKGRDERPTAGRP